jgi:hypothetical protein
MAGLTGLTEPTALAGPTGLTEQTEQTALAGPTGLTGLTDRTDIAQGSALLGLSYNILSLIAIVLMPAETCDAESCESFRAVCGSCRALRAFFAETREAFSGTYVVCDSVFACAAAHRAGLVFDPRALSGRIARDFAFFPRMRSLLLAAQCPIVDGADDSVVMYMSLPLRCVSSSSDSSSSASSSSAWTSRVTDLSIRGSWLGTCSELAAFTSLRSLALVECRCHTVAGLAWLELESLTVDALEFYATRRDGRINGPVTHLAYEELAPILRARRLFVKRVPFISTAFSALS